MSKTTGHICPMCDSPASKDDFPFCSNRCRMLDLGKWLGGDYAIPAVEAEKPTDEDDEWDGRLTH